jgi:hypothetical protein
MNDPEQEVLRVVIDALPVPDDTVSVEKLLEFRGSRESVAALAALRRWMHKLGSSQPSRREINLEFRALLSDYELRLSTHQLAQHHGTIEILLSSIASVIGALIGSDPLGKGPSLFSLHRQRIRAKADELDLPGRELAYIVKARSVAGQVNFETDSALLLSPAYRFLAIQRFCGRGGR